MTVNVGTLDRVLRAILGAALIYLGLASGLPLFDSAIYKYGAAAIGAVMLIVAIVRVCPVYTMLGIKTCRNA